MDEDISNGANGNRIQDRAWNHAAGIADFIADIAYVVIAHVVVYGDEGRAAETQEKSALECECSWRKIKREFRVEMRKADDEYGRHGGKGSNPQRDRDFAEKIDSPAQQNHGNDPDARCYKLLAAHREPRPKIRRVISEADHSRRNFKRPADHELPNEEESHQAAPRLMPVSLPQEVVRAA